MSQEETFQNSFIFWKNTGWELEGRLFPAADWNMTVTFTRKRKPIREGTIAMCTQPLDPLRLVERRRDGWHLVYPHPNVDIPWGGSLEEQDECARRAYRPLLTVEWPE